ncbi:tensin-4-like [Narcine bancroftii]|uniref:tensin-4-like n=1 Tax=Narcine bancroftii TaxID=1343680 RepID=UPI003831C2E2
MMKASSRSPNLDRGQGGCLVPRMETIVLNGTSVNHSRVIAMCPDRVKASGLDPYQPSEKWVCREISLPSTPCHQVHGYSSQKPPIHDRVQRVGTTQVIAHQAPAASQDRVQALGKVLAKTSCAESEPLSPSLDATIENLNNLILELDPTFQPLHLDGKRSRLSSHSKMQLNPASMDSPLDAPNPDIPFYNEWDSRTWHSGSTSMGSKCKMDSPGLGLQTTAPSSTIPSLWTPETMGSNLFSAGQSECPSLLHSSHTFSPRFKAPSPECQTGEHLTSSSMPVTVQSSRHHATDSTSSQPIPVPASSSYTGAITNSLPHQLNNSSIQREASGSYLSTSAGSDNFLSLCHSQQHRLGDSASSLLSTSPGSETLGSLHSLLSDDGEAGRIYRSAGSTYGSSGSFVNLKSPYSVSPSVCKSSFSDQQLYQSSGKPLNFHTLPLPQRSANTLSSQGTLGSANPGLVLMQQGKNLQGVKTHANSCPASATSSWTDIPLLLVNGSSLYLDQNSGSSSTLPPTSCATEPFPKSSSTTSLTDTPCDTEPTVKFVQDTTKYWYKPNMSRDQAIEMLKDEEPGSFIIRESSTYIGSFGLAMKVSSSSPESPEKKMGDSPIESVRHFLIEFSPKGVCLKGCPQEPYFGSLSAFVYQHCITPMSLPNKLRLPRRESLKDCSDGSSSDSPGTDTSGHRKQKTAYSVLYLKSVTMESLTGPQAVLKAASWVLEQESLPEVTAVQFKVSEQGITLTDSKRKLFFRRHYQAGSINHCGLDPLQRKWQKGTESSRIFAFVAKKQGISSENVCHLFAELERDNSAHLIISLVTSTLLDPQRR